jgi:futalosine hydrolase
MPLISDICPMNILLVSATGREILPTTDFINAHTGADPARGLSILITGIGSTAATYHLCGSIYRNRPDLILQAGIAGSFLTGKNHEVVGIKEDLFADTGVWENGKFKTIFDLNLAKANDFPFTNGMLTNPNEKLAKLSGLQMVRGITVNEITTSAEKIDWYQQNLSPDVESMEGAAFHYVCLQQQIPFLQIRAVSNRIGERDKNKWDLAGSINALNEKLIFIIQKIQKEDAIEFGI